MKMDLTLDKWTDNLKENKPFMHPLERLLPEYDYSRYEDIRNLPRTPDVFMSMQKHERLSCRLPKPMATAGKVLEHAVATFQKHSPITFKFGITHNPSFRWSNSKFGYEKSVERFQDMVIIYAAGNPHGPAFLEAALISRFASAMSATNEWL